MRRAVDGVLARLRERVTPRLARLDRPGIPRAVICRNRVHERIVVGPGNGATCGYLDPFRSEHHRAHLRLRGIRQVRWRPPRAALCRRFTSRAEIPAQRKRNRELEPAADSVDTPRRALECGGIRVRDLQRQRVWGVGNRDLKARAPGELLAGPPIDQRRGIPGEREPATQPNGRAAADRVPGRIAMVAVGEQSAGGDQPQAPDIAGCRQLRVDAPRGLVVAGLERNAALPVAGEPLPLVRERGGHVGRRRIIETDEQWEWELITEEERRRIRDFSERGVAHSESVHEVELQRAARAQPAARQVRWPLEDGLARGYVSESNDRGEGAGQALRSDEAGATEPPHESDACVRRRSAASLPTTDSSSFTGSDTVPPVSAMRIG